MRAFSRTSVLFCCALFVGVAAQGQTPVQPAPSSHWTAGNISVFAGSDHDVFRTMTLDNMLDHAQNPDELIRDLGGYEGDYFSRVDGMLITANVGLNPMSRLRPVANDNQELRIGIAIRRGREAMIEYTREQELTPDSIQSASVIYCNLDNEAAVDAAYLFKAKLGNKIQVFAGLGGTFGSTFDKQMLLIFSNSTRVPNSAFPGQEDIVEEDSHIETYDARNSMYTRVYVPYGASYRFFRRFELSVEGRIGTGFQKVFGGDTHMMKRTGSALAGIRYHIEA